MFEEKYIIMETISRRAQKCTSIVKDKRDIYYIAKKVRVDDKKTLHEISLMRSLSHPNIISLHEIIWEEPWAYVIEQYCEEGDLEYYLKRQIRLKRKIQEEIVSRWMLQILLALEYLHHSKVIHRDIRPKNIFLTSNGNIKLGSFRASKQLQAEVNYANTLINSSYYMTPQLMQGKKYDAKVDIWAFGCVLYEVCWLKPLINVVNMADLLNKLSNGKVEELPATYSKQLNIIYLKAMKRNPNERVSAQDLLKTNYFLGALQKFVNDQGLNLNILGKVPIKKYNIHRSKIQRLKQKKKLLRTPSMEKKQNMLPRIEMHVNSVEKKSQRGKSRQMIPPMVQTPIIKRTSLTKDHQKNISTQKKKIKTQTHRSRQKHDKDKQIHSMVSERLQRDNYKEAKSIMAPPLLPKPTKKIERAITEKVDHSFTQKKISPRKKGVAIEENESGNFETTMSKESLSKELANFQKKDLKEINENLNKMFENWKLGQEEEIQFDFEEQNQLRLTSKQTKEQSACLLKTFKSKLEQLVEEINYKYCPDMQPITQKTSQFELDSNSFSTFNHKFKR